MITGMWRSRASSLRRRRTSKPSISGIMMSSRIRSTVSLVQPLEGVPAMDRRHRLVVEQLQLLRQHVAIERLVVDDQDAGRRRHRGPSRRPRIA